LPVAVFDGGGQGLGEEIHILEARHQPRLLCGEDLPVIEIRGVRDHHLVEYFPGLLLRRALELTQDIRADLLGGFFHTAQVDTVAAPHHPLYRKHGAFRVHDSPGLGLRAHDGALGAVAYHRRQNLIGAVHLHHIKNILLVIVNNGRRIGGS
jgi:hypothetical protein